MKLTKKQLKARIESGRKRRGVPNPAHSFRMKNKWKKDKAYRKRMLKLQKRKGNSLKKKWATKAYRKKMQVVAKVISRKVTQALRNKWKDKKFRKHMLKVRKQQGKDAYKWLAEEMKRRWSDPVYYKKMCKIRKTQSRGNQLRHPVGSWYRCKYSDTLWMRSSWEVAFARWLDHCGIKWEYESKKFCLGKGKHYTPDFYLPSQDEYVELKGWFTERDKAKMGLFKQLYPDVKLYMFFGKNLAQVLQFRKAA